jgi:ferritin-like metal-binding protein YciE
MVNLIDWVGWVNRLKNVVTEMSNYISDIDFRNLSYEQMVELNNWLSLLLNILDEIKVEQLNKVADDLLAIRNILVDELKTYTTPSFDVTGEDRTSLADEFLREVMQRNLLNALKTIKDFADIALRTANEIYTKNPDALYSDFENSKDKVLVYFYLFDIYEDIMQLLDNLEELLNRFAYSDFLDVAKNFELRRLMQEYTLDTDDALQKVEQLLNTIGDKDLRISFEHLVKLFEELSALNKIIITANIMHNSGRGDDYIEQYEETFNDKIITASDFIINFKDLLKAIKRKAKSKTKHK